MAFVTWSSVPSPALGESLAPVGENFYVAGWAGQDAVGGRPAAAFDGTNFLVVWRDGESVIRGSRVATGGWALDVNEANIIMGTGAGRPSVAFDGTNFLVVWVDGDVLGTRVRPDGTLVDSTPIRFTTGAPAMTRDITVAFDGVNYLVVYRTNASQIRAFRCSTDGVNLDGGTGFYIGGGFFPWVAFDGENYLVAWTTDSGGWDFNIRGALVSPEGTVLNGFWIAQGWRGQQRTSVAFGETVYLVVWWDNSEETGTWDENKADVRGTRVSTEGVALDDPPIRIADRVRGEVPVVVAFDGTDFLVAWQEDHDQMNFRLTDVYGRKVTTEGEVLEAVSFSTALGHQFGPRLAYGGDHYLAVWSESMGRRCHQCVWGQILEKRRLDEGIARDDSSLSEPSGNVAAEDQPPWEDMNYPGGGELFQVWAFDSGDVYVASQSSALAHYDGVGWRGIMTNHGSKYGMSADPNGDLWTTGWCRHIERYDGDSVQNWGCQLIPEYGHTAGMGVWAREHDDVLVVGEGGYSQSYDGLDWSDLTTGVTVDLQDLWGAGSDVVYAVGGLGTVLRHDGVTWAPETQTASFQCLNSVWARHEDDVYAVGDWGTILHFDGDDWSSQHSGTEAHLFGVWGHGDTDVYAVGTSGTILHFDGESWRSEESGITDDLNAIDGGGGRIWAVGQDGIALARIIPCEDEDGDHFAVCDSACLPRPEDECGDCDDDRAGAYPGAPELCNGRDDDCDAGTEDGEAEGWYLQPCDGPDADMCPEGLFECSAGQQACTDLSGDTPELCGNDEDDDCNGLNDVDDPECDKPPCPDLDGDDFLVCDTQCHIPYGKTCGDCDDEEATAHPASTEICLDGVDNDCDDTADNPSVCFQLVAPAYGRQCFADDPPPTFDWSPGSMNRFKVTWSRSASMGKPKKTTGKTWLTADSYTPAAMRWQGILELGKTTGTVYWMVKAKDGLGSLENSEMWTMTLAPAEPAVLTAPPEGEVLADDAPPPTLMWEAEHNAAYKVVFAWRADMTGKPKVKSGKGYTLAGTQWIVPADTWNKIVTRIAPKNVDGTVYYRIDSRDGLRRKTRGEVRTLRIVSSQ